MPAGAHDLKSSLLSIAFIYFIYLFIYDEIVQEYTEKYKEKKMKK